MKKNNAVKYFHDWHFNELTGSPVFTQVGIEFHDPYHKLEWTFGPIALVFMIMAIILGGVFGWIAAAICGGLAVACFLLAWLFETKSEKLYVSIENPDEDLFKVHYEEAKAKERAFNEENADIILTLKAYPELDTIQEAKQFLAIYGKNAPPSK